MSVGTIPPGGPGQAEKRATRRAVEFLIVVVAMVLVHVAAGDLWYWSQSPWGLLGLR